MTRKRLIYVGSGGGGAFQDASGVYTHFSTGLLLDYFAQEYDEVCWCAPKESVKTPNLAFKLPENVVHVPMPKSSSTLAATLKLKGYSQAWKDALKEPGDLFIRGIFPGAAELYKLCVKKGFHPLHWLVGNPIALLQSHKRNGFVMDRLALCYAENWERVVKRGVDQTQGAFLCFGQELYARMEGHKRYNIVAAPILESQISLREDTCQGDVIRVLFVGFIRPEKGVQYLVEALPHLRCQRRVELVCVGPKNDRYAEYNALLDAKIKELGLEDRVSFPGYMDQNQIFEVMRSCDVFVLPSLSEGAPYVVVESRSQGLPTIATAVGGIPTSINDGEDGLLVPPKDPVAIADAIDCVIEDEALRKDLVEKGYAKVRELTFDKFVKKIVGILDELNGRGQQ